MERPDNSISEEIIRKLTKENVNVPDKDGRTPIYHAIIRDNLNEFQTCLDYGADLNHTCLLYGWTPLHAYFKGPLLYNTDKWLATFAKYNVNWNAKDLMGRTPLFFAGRFSECLKALLKYDEVDIHARDMNQQTALHYYVTELEWPGIILILINRGADVNATALLNLTPLAIAVREDKTPIIKLLLFFGADLHLYDKLLINGRIEIHPNYYFKIIILLHNAGLNFHKVELPPMNDPSEGVQQIKAYIEYSMKNPLSLKQLCRVACRQQFGRKYVYVIDTAHIPDSLKLYLAFEDIDLVSPYG